MRIFLNITSKKKKNDFVERIVDTYIHTYMYKVLITVATCTV